MASTSSGDGYWLVGSDGGVFAFGDAGFHGSMGGMTLARPIVGMAATPSGDGYWLVASDGGIFTFGDAVFHGSTGDVALNQPIVAMAATPSGDGYWLVASDGGVFTFGDAGFHGSTGDVALNQPIVGMAASPDGYWLVASDGGIFTFGDAGFHGSMGATALTKPIVGMAATGSGGGYWLVGSDGGIFGLGDAVFHGSAGDVALAAPIVGMSRTLGTRPVPTVTAIAPGAGLLAGGTAVTISGTGFEGATAVTFGAAAATNVVVVSATEVTVTSPAGTGTVDVTVTTAAGTSDPSSADHFAYGTVPGAPTNVIAVGGTNCQFTVTFVPSTSPGSSPITSYTATALSGGYTLTEQGPSIGGNPIFMDFANIANGSYAFTVHATNAVGDGPESVASLTGSSLFCGRPDITKVFPLSGQDSGGTLVMVTGTGFTGVTGVFFGNNSPAMSFTVIDDSHLTATSPVGLDGPVDIQLSNPGVQSLLTPADQFTYTPNQHLPSAPRNVSATIACTTPSSATVTFSPPDSTGTDGPVLDYTATSSGGNSQTESGSPIAVGGLNLGQDYTFTVVARNMTGPGVASALSNSVTNKSC